MINKTAPYKTKTCRPVFKAVPIGETANTVKGKVTNIQLLKLEESDMPFLGRMFKKLDIRKLKPQKTAEEDFYNWQTYADNAYSNASLIEDLPNSDFRGFLAVCDKKPCGITTFMKTDYGFYLTDLATWPVKIGESVKGAGKSLIRQTFETCKNARKLDFHSALSGHGNPPLLYENIGFIFPNKEAGYAYIEKEGVKKSSALLDEFLHYKPIREEKSIDLNKELSLDFLG